MQYSRENCQHSQKQETGASINISLSAPANSICRVIVEVLTATRETNTYEDQKDDSYRETVVDEFNDSHFEGTDTSQRTRTITIMDDAQHGTIASPIATVTKSDGSPSEQVEGSKPDIISVSDITNEGEHVIASAPSEHYQKSSATPVITLGETEGETAYFSPEKRHITVDVDEFTVVLHQNSGNVGHGWEHHPMEDVKIFALKTGMDKLFGDLVPMHSKKLEGYPNAYTFSEMQGYFAIGFHEERPDMGVCIRFSAQAWAWYKKRFEKASGMKTNILAFLRSIQSVHYCTRLTRVDIATDFFNYEDVLNIGEVREKYNSGEIVVKDHRGRKIKYQNSGNQEDGVDTFLRVGVRGENTNGYLDIYDKKDEQIRRKGSYVRLASACRSWIRMEASYRKEYARQIGKQLLAIDEEELAKYLVAKMLDKFRFYDTKREMYTEFTKALMDIVEGKGYSTLTTISPRNEDLASRTRQLIERGSLMPIAYEVDSIWGHDYAVRLFGDLRAFYEQDYKLFAETNTRLQRRVTKSQEGLKDISYEDYFSGILPERQEEVHTDENV